jgi:hypothetical protein
MAKPEFQVEDDTEIVDEDEYKAITKLHSVKQAYREAHTYVFSFLPPPIKKRKRNKPK